MAGFEPKCCFCKKDTSLIYGGDKNYYHWRCLYINHLNNGDLAKKVIQSVPKKHIISHYEYELTKVRSELNDR